MRPRLLFAGILSLIALLAPGNGTATASNQFVTVQLAGAAAGTEPRVTIDNTGHRWVITNDVNTGDAVVYGSANGLSWTRTAGEPANQSAPTIDVDLVSTHTHRLVAVELDFGGINFRVSYSDNGGKTWIASQGAELADTDRPWLAVGPDDPTTHLPRVYLLFHNLFSGTMQHNMFVQTSTDGGATFGPPVPITLPAGETAQAYQDLQCADSGGPSDIFVNQHTGRVYAVWGTRSSQVGGGCGASATGTFEVNVVAATRIWVATSPDASPGSWTTSLAVDDNATGKIVGMQLGPGALDTQGNVYVAYPESIKPYPDYDGAAIKYVWAPPTLSHWSAPVTVAPAGGAGHVLPHIVAGNPGNLDLAYFTGVTRPGKSPAWYTTVTQIIRPQHGLTTMVTTQVSPIPTYTGTASELMGACVNNQAIAGAANGLICGRSTDVWGIALDPRCFLTITWPTVQNDAAGSKPGTFVTTQTSGTPICSQRP